MYWMLKNDINTSINTYKLFYWKLSMIFIKKILSYFWSAGQNLICFCSFSFRFIFCIIYCILHFFCLISIFQQLFIRILHIALTRRNPELLPHIMAIWVALGLHSLIYFCLITIAWELLNFIDEFFRRTLGHANFSNLVFLVLFYYFLRLKSFHFKAVFFPWMKIMGKIRFMLKIRGS